MEKSAESQGRLTNAWSHSLGSVIINDFTENDVIKIMLNLDGGLFIDRIGKGMEEGGVMAARHAQIVIPTSTGTDPIYRRSSQLTFASMPITASTQTPKSIGFLRKDISQHRCTK